MKAVTTEQMRELDRLTIAAGTPDVELMERAGYAVARATFKLLRKLDARSALLFAGKGNNGGDAFVVARHLAAAGCTATLVLLCRRGDVQGAALHHFQQLVGVTTHELPALEDLRELVRETEPAVVVDGLLGTGLTGEVREPYLSAIQFINQLRVPVVSIDVPSGLGTADCVRADVTVTIGLPKIDLLRPSAVDYIGRIEAADIGLLDESVASDVEMITRADIVLPERRRSAHKGDFGHLLIIAGSEGYTGAPVLCAHAAARSGAGLVTLAIPRNIYSIVAGNCPPEVMPRPLDKFESFQNFDAVAIGPGMGQSPEAQSFVQQLLANVTVPTVIDADALNALGSATALQHKAEASAPWVLTPHPGELGRLVGMSAQEVQAARWELARQYAQQHDVTLVLKGAGTVVTDKAGKLWINLTGNPGMAKGGMGDALTGIIGALLAQKLAPLDAARAGVYLHGLAGDLAAERVGETALLATDLIGSLGEVYLQCDCAW